MRSEDDKFGMFKRLWALPFVWCFTWCSYWLLRDIFLFNKSYLELGLWNYLGISLSVVVPLLKVAFSLLKNKLAIEQAKTGIHVSTPMNSSFKRKESAKLLSQEYQKVKDLALPRDAKQNKGSEKVEPLTLCQRSGENLVDCFSCQELITCIRRKELFVKNLTKDRLNLESENLSR